MIGNIYKIYCKPTGYKDWKEYHLMPLVEFNTTSYHGCDAAVKCLVLETGAYHELYVDVLEGEGIQVG